MRNRICLRTALHGSHFFVLAIIFAVLLSSCASTGKESEAALEAGDYNTAISILTGQLKESPENAELNYMMGRAYLKMGEAQMSDPDMGGDPGSAYYDAVTFFQKALELDKSNYNARLGLANAQYYSSDFEEAQSNVEICLQKEEADPKALLLAGVIGIARYSRTAPEEGRPILDTAIERLEKAVELDPGLEKAHIRLGDAYLQKNDLAHAREAYQRGIRSRSTSNEVHSRLLLLKGVEEGVRPKEAIAFYEVILKEEKDLSPGEAGRLWWFLGTWYSHQGMDHYNQEEYDLARKAFDQHLACLKHCAAACPDFEADAAAQSASAHLNRGWASLKLEEFDGAERDFFIALDYDPEAEGTVYAIDTLGFAVSQAEGLEGGLGFFERLNKRYDQRHQWWNDYGYFSLETNMRTEDPDTKFEKTLAIYKKALELKPGYPRYVNDSAMLIDYYLDPEGKRKAEVEAMYQQAWIAGKEGYENPFTDEREKTVHYSAFTDALVNLSRLYLMEERLEESRTMLVELIAVSPERWEVILLQGALDEDRPEEERDLYRKALVGKLTEEEVAALQKNLRQGRSDERQGRSDDK